MHVLLAIAAVACIGGAALAGDHRGGRDRTELDLFVPIDPWEHERLYWKRRSDRHLVPGGVSIDGESPYVCDLDDERFTDRERFVGHLRRDHAVPAEQIPRSLVPVDGVIHFTGE